MPACVECQEDVEEGATRCPHCGYEPAAKHRKHRQKAMRSAKILAFTLIGLPIAALLLVVAAVHRYAEQNKTVADEW